MADTKSILVVGCSMTDGNGLAQGHQDNRLWINQIKHEMFPSASMDNLSMTGRNNHWIFCEAATAIIQKQYDLVIVAWTGIPKYNIHFGLETYSVHSQLHDVEIGLNNHVIVTSDWVRETGQRLRQYHNDHWDIVDLVKYVNILSRLHPNIFFVNTIGPWSARFFDYRAIKEPNDLTDYEQKLLQSNIRDDSNVFELYNMIHQHYQHYGGIHQDRWLNLYCNFKQLAIDTISDTNKHPGIASQTIIATHIGTALKERL
jgi:hypothetical protein